MVFPGVLHDRAARTSPRGVGLRDAGRELLLAHFETIKTLQQEIPLLAEQPETVAHFP